MERIFRNPFRISKKLVIVKLSERGGRLRRLMWHQPPFKVQLGLLLCKEEI
jgi:hypothetical protein